MMQQSGAATTEARANEIATDALQRAEQALEAVRAGSGEGRVIVRNNPEGVVIAIPGEGGDMKRIVLSQDNGRIVSLEGISAPSSSRRRELPGGVVDMMAIIFGAVTLMTLGGPIVRAWARRFERRHEARQQVQVEQRLAAIEQAIDSVAVEVERISEGQRFTSKLLAERAPAEMERVR